MMLSLRNIIASAFLTVILVALALVMWFGGGAR
jgi:hypothetical protein